MSKFSANHAASVAYIDKAGGITQFSDERSADAGVQALRRLITVKPVASFRLDQSAATVWTKSGAMHEARIEHATGTVSNPLSDQQLREKFFGNAEPVIGAQRARALADMIVRLDTLPDIGDLVRASV
jgi:2-methylcitrate dehydratase PrpD